MVRVIDPTIGGLGNRLYDPMSYYGTQPPRLTQLASAANAMPPIGLVGAAGGATAAGGSSSAPEAPVPTPPPFPLQPPPFPLQPPPLPAQQPQPQPPLPPRRSTFAPQVAQQPAGGGPQMTQAISSPTGGAQQTNPTATTAVPFPPSRPPGHGTTQPATPGVEHVSGPNWLRGFFLAGQPSPTGMSALVGRSMRDPGGSNY